MIAGTFGGFIGANSSLTLSFIGTTLSGGDNIAPHVNAQAGDLAIFCHAAISLNDPNGYTSIHGTGNSLRVSGRILQSGDLGVNLTGVFGSPNAPKALRIFRPSKAISSFSGVNWSQSQSSGNPPTVNTTVAGTTSPIIVMGVAGTNTGSGSVPWTVSPSFTLEDYINNSDYRMRSGATIYNTNPLDQSVDIGDLGSGNIQAVGVIQVT